MKLLFQKGISLLELLLVILVAAGIISAAVTYYSQTLRASRVSQAVNFLQQVAKASHEWLQIPDQTGQYPANFSGLTALNQLVVKGLLPCENNSCNQNSWGGTNSANGTADSKYIQITLSQMPAADCALLQQEMADIAPPGPSQQNYCQNNVGAHTTNYQVYL